MRLSRNVTTPLRRVDWLGSAAPGPEYRHAADEEAADRGSSKIQTLVWLFAFSLLRLPDGLQFAGKKKKKCFWKCVQPMRCRALHVAQGWISLARIISWLAKELLNFKTSVNMEQSCPSLHFRSFPGSASVVVRHKACLPGALLISESEPPAKVPNYLWSWLGNCFHCEQTPSSGFLQESFIKRLELINHQTSRCSRLKEDCGGSWELQAGAGMPYRQRGS